MHLQKQMSYLWVSTAHNRSYQDATTITKAERINIATRFQWEPAAVAAARPKLTAKVPAGAPHVPAPVWNSAARLGLRWPL